MTSPLDALQIPMATRRPWLIFWGVTGITAMGIWHIHATQTEEREVSAAPVAPRCSNLVVAAT